MHLTQFDMNGCFSNKRPFFFLLVLVLAFASCSKTDNNKEKTLFSVNGETRTVEDFENAYVKYLIKTGQNDTKYGREVFLTEQVDEILMAQAASDLGYLDHETYHSAIAHQTRKSVMDTYFVDEMDEVLEMPTEEELRLAFAKNKRRVYVRHLYSRRESDLMEPYQRLRNGESFVDVANDFYETAEYDSLAGYLGPIKYFGVDDAFADAAFNTNQGDFTKPVQSQFGFHIIYVEYIEFPAMLAEDEFQYRKKGLTSQVRLRNQSLAANGYIRDLMGKLLVEVDRDNVLSLMDTIKELDGEEIIQNNGMEEQQKVWNDRRLDQLKASFDTETVLASYVLNGNRTEFTFQDYLNWLPYMSFDESKNRTGASIGRAMRNQVLYELGMDQDLENDPRVKREVRKRALEVLSDLYERDLTIEALRDTSEIIIPASFRDRMIRDKNFQMIATYWYITAEDMPSAREIREALEDGKDPSSYDSYHLKEEVDVVPTDPDYKLVRDGLMEMPYVAHSGDKGWMVMGIDSRTITEIDENTGDLELTLRYRVYDALKSTVDSLKEEADIFVDWELFNEIYEVWKKKES
ncbi:MAG TPA: hypothetical protein DEQ34_08410 [Balneolaceae bacterium]|nr:hypothetical protein [Balneolaceae bacterium]|tara:strand:- start:248186 stop:249916 length:1731 start_codon:yes stop_codon:yes gene_type:complete